MAISTERDLTDFLLTYTRDMSLSDEEPGAILDRYFVPDFVFRNDGLDIDRQRMIEHVRPVRRQVDAETMAAHETTGLDIHDTLVRDDRFAARYTMRTTMRKGKIFAAEIHMFGRLAADGRILRIDQITRQLDDDQ